MLFNGMLDDFESWINLLEKDVEDLDPHTQFFTLRKP